MNVAASLGFALVMAVAGSPALGQPFANLDPVWAAQRVDASLLSSEMGPAWAALKAAAPSEYQALTENAATAIINGQAWRPLARTFIQEHVADLTSARAAPASVQSAYQKQKASFLVYLSKENIAACAVLGSGQGELSALSNLNDEQTRRYANLIAVTVATIGAGRATPVLHGEVTDADVSVIERIMADQGVSREDADRLIDGQVDSGPGELCRLGVIRNNALAAAPEDVVAKMAFR